MKFQKYPSIKNHYQTPFVEKIKWEGKNVGTWVVTEKIHGANFSFWYDGKELKIAKRSGWFPLDATSFYSSQRIVERYGDRIKKMYSEVGADWLTVYGEIYGGSYPHEDVPPTQSKKVQNGVWYSSDNEFMAFDILTSNGFKNFIDTQERCELNRIPFSKILFQGTMDECLEYQNDFQSTIAEDEHGLPSIADNICEGIVIKPNKTQFLRTGERVILKSKNEKFKEKSSRKPREPIKVEGVLKEVVDEIRTYATENRYNSVVSKIGEVNVSHFGEIIRAFSKDIFEEFNSAKYNDLEKKDRKFVNKCLSKEIAGIVRGKLILGE